MQRFSLYRKELEILAITKMQFQKNQFFNGFAASIDELFFVDTSNLRPEFLELIPVDKLEATKLLLLFLKSIYMAGGDGISSQRGGKKTKQQVIEEITELEKMLLEQVKSKFNYMVFYSWQSDIDSAFNRSFINDCLNDAIERINDAHPDAPPLNLDKDTRGVAGSPDIVNTILDKIDHCICFVADVTPICKKGDKCISNPNVMFELGYALSSLNYDRIIIICNEAFCDVHDLPFDLGLKRVMRYKFNEELRKNKQECKKRLTAQLIDAITTIVYS